MSLNKIIEIAGKAGGIVGVVVCLATGLQRLGGGHFLFGLESATLFDGGVALMVFYCVAKLHLLGSKT